jgi:hypothetical protein
MVGLLVILVAIAALSLEIVAAVALTVVAITKEA